MTQLTSSRLNSPAIHSSHRNLMRSACTDPCGTIQCRPDGMEIRQTVQCGRLLVMVRELIEMARWRGPRAAIPQYRGGIFTFSLKGINHVISSSMRSPPAPAAVLRCATDPGRWHFFNTRCMGSDRRYE